MRCCGKTRMRKRDITNESVINTSEEDKTLRHTKLYQIQTRYPGHILSSKQALISRKYVLSRKGLVAVSF